VANLNRHLTISEVEIYPLKPKGGLIGFASFLIEDSFYVGGVGIHTKPSGEIRLVYPTKTLPNGKELPLCHPINQAVGASVEQAVAQKLSTLAGSILDTRSGKIKSGRFS